MRGTYQDEEGQIGCKPCKPGTTTLGFGSKSAGDCGCDAGTINIANADVECVTCIEGLRCPFGSSIATLQSGQSEIGEAYTPTIQKGFYATMDQPIAVYKCGAEEHCPGGLPGQCAGGREITPCAECPAGTSWAKGKGTCFDCDGGMIALWILALGIFLLGLVAAYYFLNPPIGAKARPTEAAGMAAGLVVATVQCVAIMGFMTATRVASFDDFCVL